MLAVASLAAMSGRPASTEAHALPLYARPLIVEARSADSTRNVTFGIVHEGAFLVSVGVMRPSAGHVVLDRGRGSATTPAVLEFADSAGTVELRSEPGGADLLLVVRAADRSETQSLARGRLIRIERDAEGRIRVAAAR